MKNENEIVKKIIIPASLPKVPSRGAPTTIEFIYNFNDTPN